MKACVCIVLLAAAALAAPEGKRDKRGYLHSHASYSLGSFDHDFHGYHGHDFGSYELGHSASYIEHAPIYHAPKIVSSHKIVEVPRIVEVKKVVSYPKVVSVPKIVKVSKIVESPHYYAPSVSHGWW